MMTTTDNDILKEAVSKMIIRKQTVYPCTLMEGGLNVWESGMFTQLIREAARCNDYSSDVVYDLNDISEKFRTFDPKHGFDTKYIAFRKLGVDSESFIRCKIKRGTSLYNEYFAFYTIDVLPDEGNYYNVVFREYSV